MAMQRTPKPWQKFGTKKVINIHVLLSTTNILNLYYVGLPCTRTSQPYAHERTRIVISSQFFF